VAAPSPTLTDPNAWWYFLLCGVPSPGSIPRSGIKGFERETGWDKKKGKGLKGATLTLTSAPPVEGTITLQLIGPGGFYYWGGPSTDFAQWDNFVSQALSITPEKQQAQGLAIFHPQFASIGLTTVVVKKYGGPMHVGNGLYQCWIEMIEWGPPPPVSVVSTASSKKPDQPDPDTTPPLDPREIALQQQIAFWQNVP
jgi:hypothetical protein